MTTASGRQSHSEGHQTVASGFCSHAEGSATKATAYYAHSEGLGTIAAGRNQTAMGKYNVKDTSSLLIVGNGTSDTARKNAFKLDASGNGSFTGSVSAVSSVSSTGADYAEYFEWLDGNPNNEDRRGYFVTLEDDKIKIANPGDYILGVVSGQPCIIGNHDQEWMGKYMMDEFGSFIVEQFEYEEIEYDDDYNEYTVTKTGTRYKENPEYDPNREYIQRKDRPEWDTVGMIGVLAVRDDGTCKANSFCTLTNGGLATASDSGYRVIKRVSDSVVKIIFK